MMETIIFLLNGFAIYLLSDWLLKIIERNRGKVFENRAVVFFFIFFPLILISFQLINKIT